MTQQDKAVELVVQAALRVMQETDLVAGWDFTIIASKRTAPTRRAIYVGSTVDTGEVDEVLETLQEYLIDINEGR